jgi:hypothetical protein
MKHTYKGYEITKGNYRNSNDDNIDGWYIDDPDSSTIDRRGRGHQTLADAKAQIDEWENNSKSYNELGNY